MNVKYKGNNKEFEKILRTMIKIIPLQRVLLSEGAALPFSPPHLRSLTPCMLHLLLLVVSAGVRTATGELDQSENRSRKKMVHL